jgi:hypothetical protein
MGLSLSMPLGLMAAHRGRDPGLAELVRVFAAGARALRRLVPVLITLVRRHRRVRRVRVLRRPVLRLPRLRPVLLRQLPRPGPVILRT